MERESRAGNGTGNHERGPRSGRARSRRTAPSIASTWGIERSRSITSASASCASDLVVRRAAHEPGEEHLATVCAEGRCVGGRHPARVHLVEHRAAIRERAGVVDELAIRLLAARRMTRRAGLLDHGRDVLRIGRKDRGARRRQILGTRAATARRRRITARAGSHCCQRHRGGERHDVRRACVHGTLTKNAAWPCGDCSLSVHWSLKWKRTFQWPAASKRTGPRVYVPGVVSVVATLVFGAGCMSFR